MKSCIYICDVMHHRLEPKRNKFSYKIFMFYLNLDKLDRIQKKLRFLSRNRVNLFSFSDTHHANFPGQLYSGKTVKDKLMDYLYSNGIAIEQIHSVRLLTNLTTMGYAFNPVSFYYCFDAKENPICAVAEVCNTFKEMKMYALPNSSLRETTFSLYTQKNFYVSPFSELDSYFKFILKVPGRTLSARVDSYKDDEPFLLSALTGKRKSLTDTNLILCFLSIPFVTLKVIGLIHWQALVLYLKKIPFISKADNIHLQQDSVKL